MILAFERPLALILLVLDVVQRKEFRGLLPILTHHNDATLKTWRRSLNKLNYYWYRRFDFIEQLWGNSNYSRASRFCSCVVLYYCMNKSHWCDSQIVLATLYSFIIYSNWSYKLMKQVGAQSIKFEKSPEPPNTISQAQLYQPFRKVEILTNTYNNRPLEVSLCFVRGRDTIDSKSLMLGNQAYAALKNSECLSGMSSWHVILLILTELPIF